LKTIFSSFLTLIAFITLCYIGVPSRLLSRNINDNRLARIKKADRILIAAQWRVKHDTVVGLTQFLPFEYGRITNRSQIQQLFPYLTENDRKIIESLFNDQDVKQIDMHEQNCITYTVKKSFNIYLINSSSEALYLVHNNHCDCHCEDFGLGSKDSSETKSLGNSWFIVDYITAREPFHG
jgi:hypothetical protein